MTKLPTQMLFRRLLADWDRLAQQPATHRAIAGWGLGVTTADEMLDLVGFRRPGHPSTAPVDQTAADAAMRSLLAIAADDQLAARLVLHRLLPGLVAIARRRPEPDAFEDLVTAAWSAIVSFNQARRPSHIASTLLRDSEYLAFRKDTRRRQVTVELAPIDELIAAPTVPVAFDELIELVTEASRRGRLSARHTELLNHLMSERLSVDAAKQMQVCERTVRTLRAQLVERLRDVALAA